MEQINRFIEKLKDKDELTLKAITKLAQSENLEVFDVLIEALKNKDARLKAFICSALGELRDTRAVEPLIEIVENDHANHWAISALGQIGDNRAFEPIAQVLEDITIPLDYQIDIRGTAAIVLGNMRDPRAFELLVKHLNDEDVDVCVSCAYALGIYGDKRAIHMLEWTQKHNQEKTEDGEYVSEVAGKAIKAIEELNKSISD